MRRGLRLGLRPAALAVLALLTAGCGSDRSPPLDSATVIPLVAHALLPGATHLIDGVVCEDRSDRLGPLACTAVVSGVEVPVLVHPPGLDGRIRVESPAEVLSAADVADRVAKRLAADTGVEARATCTPDVRVVRAGQAFDCTATDPGGREIPLVATLVDDTGSFRIDWRSEG